MIRKYLILTVFLGGIVSLYAQVQVGGRVVTNFNQSWKFQLGDYIGAQLNSYNDTLWNSVGLPHSFDAPYFGWNQFYTGYGWYRKHLTVPAGWAGKRVFLEFEAAFDDAQVFVNGQLVGEHLGGYTGFSYDVSTNLVVGDNVVAVRLNNNWNPQVPPRTGDHTFIGGIYRNVWLVATDPLHVTWFGTWVTTPTLAANSGASSTVNIQTEILNNYSTNVSCTVQTDILDANSNVVATVSTTNTISAGTTNVFNQTTPAVSNPNLWSPATPYLYRALTTVFNGTNVVDSYSTSFGFRWIQWTAANGFFLNGAHLYFHGADVHQDHAGWSDGIADTGAARDVGLIKQAGLNFIRGSHYPHSVAFANACDTNGICLWSEFPFWGNGGGSGEVGWSASSAYPTVSTDQAPFEANVHQGLTEEIRVLRNHPSIVAWSMCNEPFDSDSSVLNLMSNLLAEEVFWTHQLDPNRPAALGGCQRPDTSSTRIDKIGDVAGYNGDGATIGLFQNPGVASMVTEYGVVKGVRPGATSPGWGNLASQLNTGVTPNVPIEYAWRSGQAVWCGFDYGTQNPGGTLPNGAGTKGLLDYFRLPKAIWYWYRNEYAGVPPPASPGNGTPARIQLTTDATNFTAVDGTQDAQLIVTLLDSSGNPTSNNVPVTLTVISGPGQFPTGTNITFTPSGSGQASDIVMLAGMAAIEFRTYYSGTSVIQATSPGLTSASVTITSQGSPAWVPGVTPSAQSMPYSRFTGTVTQPPVHSYQLALNQPTSASTAAGSSSSANDGDTNTLWQAASTDTNAWWLVNFQLTFQVDSVQLIFPTTGNYHYQIQFSADNVNWTTAVDQSQNNSFEQSRTAVGNFGGGIQYLRVQFTNMPAGLTPALAEVVVGGGSGLTYPAGQLSGTIIGTDGSSNNIAANVKEAAMDWNTNTFFDAPSANGDWVGLDLGSNVKTNIVQVGYCPRVDSGGSSYSSRMVGGIFQGANQPDFSDATNLFTISSAPAQGVVMLQSVTNTTAFHYVRYMSPAGGFCNVSELEFFPGAAVVTSATNTIWSGSVNGTWDTTTANWVTNGVATTYHDGVTVQFDDSASGNITVSASATRTPGAMVVSNTLNNYSIGGSAIAGTGGLTKSGTGTLTLTAANTFTGNIVVNNGTLADSYGLSSPNITASGLGNPQTAGRTVTINNGGTLAFNANSVSGNFLGNSVSTTIAIGFIINQGGTLQLNYGNTPVGAITLNGGTMSATASSGGSHIYYGTYYLNGDVTVGGSSHSTIISTSTSATGNNINLTINAAGTRTFTVAQTGDSPDLIVSSPLGDAANLTSGGSDNLLKAGAGTMRLNSVNLYSGTTTVSAGTLVAGADAPNNANGAFGKSTTAITLGNTATTSGNASPSLMIGGAFTVSRPVTVAAQATSGTYTIGGSTDNNATFAGAITLNEPLTVSQTANTGGNALTISGGINSGGGPQTLTFSGPGNMQVTTTALSDGSGQLSVNLTGGMLTLNTANTYTGATTVTNGFLQVNGSLAAGSTVSVGAGGQLGGTGVINGAATIQAGGTLSPGGSLSTLTFGGSLTLAAGSTSFFEISKSPTTNDVAKIFGALTNGGTLIVTNISASAPAFGDRFKLFNAGSYSGAFSSVQLPPLSAGLAWNTSALNTNGTLSVVVTPHPVFGSPIIFNGGLIFNGNSGVGYANYYLLGSTNLAIPISNWTRLLTNQFDAGGNFNFTNPINPSWPQGFYLLQIP